MAKYEVTCTVRDLDGDTKGEQVTEHTGTNDSSPAVARNSALMKAINDDAVDWESEGSFEVDCFTP